MFGARPGYARCSATHYVLLGSRRNMSTQLRIVETVSLVRLKKATFPAESALTSHPDHKPEPFRNGSSGSGRMLCCRGDILSRRRRNHILSCRGHIPDCTGHIPDCGAHVLSCRGHFLNRRDCVLNLTAHFLNRRAHLLNPEVTF